MSLSYRTVFYVMFKSRVLQANTLLVNLWDVFSPLQLFIEKSKKLL